MEKSKNEQMPELRIIIAGSRDFNDYEYLSDVLTIFIKERPNRRFVVVSGTARGADQLGEKFARENSIPIKRFPADWDNFGKRAGYIRNSQMLDYINQPDCEGYVFAFWDGESRGTQHMIKSAQKAGISVEIFYHKKIQSNSKKNVDK